MRFKKTIAIILASVLVIQAFSFTAFAGDSGSEKSGSIFDKELVYTAIGDSTVMGFHMNDTKIGTKYFDLANYMNECDWDCYPQLLSKKIGYKMNNLGICGLTSEGLADILTNPNADINNTEDLSMYFPREDAEAGVSKYEIPNKNNRYYYAVKAADFITINIGSNDLLKTNLCKQFMTIVSTLTNINKDGSTAKLDADFVKKFIKFMINSYQEDAFKDTVTDYKTNYKTVFDAVRKLNPNAQIALVGCYNPFSKDNLTQRIEDAIADATIWKRLGGDLSAFRTLIKPLIQMAPKVEQSSLYQKLNAKLDELEKSTIYTTLVGEIDDTKAMNTLISDLVYVFVVATVGDRIGDFIDEINEVVKDYANGTDVIYVDVPGCTVPINAMDMHPDDNGHQYIANTIFEAVQDKIKINEGTVVIRFIKNLWNTIISGDFNILSLLTILKNSL